MTRLEASKEAASQEPSEQDTADNLRAEANVYAAAADDRKADKTPPADPPIKPGSVHELGTTSVSYKDAQIDNQLAFSAAKNLKVTDLPKDCRISAWKDSVGYFFYFTDGKDGKKHHYIPASVQFIQAVKQDGTKEVLSVADLKRDVDAAMKKPKK